MRWFPSELLARQDACYASMRGHKRCTPRVYDGSAHATHNGLVPELQVDDHEVAVEHGVVPAPVCGMPVAMLAASSAAVIFRPSPYLRSADSGVEG